ncbi:6481_t:CDS:2, partial [Cetraspora pellucida]
EVLIFHSSNGDLQDPTRGDNRSESRETFDEFIYEDEDLNETEGYYMKESVLEEADVKSPAIYLTAVEDMPTQKSEPSRCNIGLDDWHKEQACKFFDQKKGLFAQDIRELEETLVLTHMINIGEARP